MKIYFTAAISAMPEYEENYRRIVDFLKKQSHTVFADHILSKSMRLIDSETPEEHGAYYRNMIRRLTEADLLVAEVSFPSTVHVGHELTLALEKDKPVLALFKKGKRPVLFWGITSDKFYAAEYTQNTLEQVLTESIDYLSEQQDTRFNFFISPKHQHYLDWISRTMKTPRAVHLRWLLERDMAANKEYQTDLGKEKQNERDASTKK